MSKPKYFTTSVDCEKKIYYSISKETTIVIEDVPAVGYRDRKDNDETDYDVPELSSKEWLDLYQEQHYTVTGLMDELVKLAKEKQSQCEPKSSEWKKMQGIIEDAQCWQIDEEFIDEL